MKFLSFLNQDDYIIYNKQLAHKIWINPTILLMDLISKYTYFKNKESLDEEWYFFNSIDNVEKDTAIKRKAQDWAIKILLENGLINRKTKGMPAKRYFKINVNNIAILMGFSLSSPVCTTVQSSMSQMDKQECLNEPYSMSQTDKHDSPKGRSNKNNNKTNNKNKEIIETFLSFYPKIISPLKIEKVIDELIDNWNILNSQELKTWIINEINYKKAQALNNPNFKILWKDPINWLEWWDWKNKYDDIQSPNMDKEQVLINESLLTLKESQQRELELIIGNRKWINPYKKVSQVIIKQMLEKVL